MNEYVELLDYMQTYEEEHGYPPNMQELATATNFGYRSSVRYALETLVNRGVLAVVKPRFHSRRYTCRKDI